MYLTENEFKNIKINDVLRVGNFKYTVIESPFYNYDAEEQGYEVLTDNGYISIYNDIIIEKRQK